MEGQNEQEVAKQTSDKEEEVSLKDLLNGVQKFAVKEEQKESLREMRDKAI